MVQERWLAEQQLHMDQMDDDSGEEENEARAHFLAAVNAGPAAQAAAAADAPQQGGRLFGGAATSGFARDLARDWNQHVQCEEVSEHLAAVQKQRMGISTGQASNRCSGVKGHVDGPCTGLRQGHGDMARDWNQHVQCEEVSEH